MTQATTYPLYTTEEAVRREAFLALMWALSYPGREQTIPVPISGSDRLSVFVNVGEALLDLETTFFTPDSALESQLLHTRARSLNPELAAYHFYLSVSSEDLPRIEAASVGTMLYPDQAATIFVGCQLENAQNGDASTILKLAGPGIQGERYVRVSGLPTEFWALRQHAVRFPLGWDIFLVDVSGKVIGLPRSTRIDYGQQG
jgi:alpha-D-ribose 1-methylphosphonate 5-triphosphate synthase subunit PhnH